MTNLPTTHFILRLESEHFCPGIDCRFPLVQHPHFADLRAEAQSEEGFANVTQFLKHILYLPGDHLLSLS